MVMSQFIGDVYLTGTSPPEHSEDPAQHRDLSLVEKYLAVLDENKKSCRAAVTDASIALDMAGFVRRRLHSSTEQMQMPPALLALALIRRVLDAPDQ
jgi:hypothetical protein